MIRVAVVASTAGSVLGKVLSVPYVRDRVCTVFSDRECGAIEVAKRFGVRSRVITSNKGADFSDSLRAEFEIDPHDLIVSFYTKLFRGDFLVAAEGKLINFHPSILPACPGRDGFGDTIRSGSTFIGATVHFIDQGMDTGSPIIQSAIPFDPAIDTDLSRHQVFVSQCKMFIQVVHWFEGSRVVYKKGERPTIKDAIYRRAGFSPNLDFDQAIDFNV